MKTQTIILLFFLTAFSTYAQVERQTDTVMYNKEPLISVDRVDLLKNVDVIANMQYALNNYWQGDEYSQSKFAMNQFRFEIKGKVSDKVYFRFRNRYTRLPDPQSQDNLSRAVDLAFVRIDLNDKWNLQLGKMCADWGGYEFDLNPIDIYEYNDIVEYADNFLSGVQISRNINSNHSLTFQVLNSRTKSYEEIYDSIPNVQESKFPAALVLNWRGNFGGGKFTTLWSYSSFLEAKSKVMHYIALGNQLNLNKTTIIYDFKYSKEDIDRKTIVTDIIPDAVDPYAAQDVDYLEHWLQVRYRFHPKWTATAIAMVSNANWNANSDPDGDSHLRTSYGLIPSIEYYPFKKVNMYFYSAYVYRKYDFSDYAETSFGQRDYTTGKFMIGFISPLVIL
jgi:hypothetical protein